MHDQHIGGAFYTTKLQQVCATYLRSQRTTSTQHIILYPYFCHLFSQHVCATRVFYNISCLHVSKHVCATGLNNTSCNVFSQHVFSTFLINTLLKNMFWKLFHNTSFQHIFATCLLKILHNRPYMNNTSLNNTVFVRRYNASPPPDFQKATLQTCTTSIFFKVSQQVKIQTRPTKSNSGHAKRAWHFPRDSCKR